MRIDGPRNLEATAQLSGSFSGSFVGKFTNKVADASLSGSFSGSFSGAGSGSFSGSFHGNGRGLGNVFKKVIVSPNNLDSILESQYSGVLLFTSQSGAGLRITQQQDQSTPEIVFDLVDIPNSSLANSTISGIELGQNLNALSVGSGLDFAAGSNYNGSTAREIQFKPSEFGSMQTLDLADTDQIIIAGSTADTTPKLLTIASLVESMAGPGLLYSNGQLELDPDFVIDSFVSTGTNLTIGLEDTNDCIIFSSSDIKHRIGNVDRLTVSTTAIQLGSGVDLDGGVSSNITDFNKITSVSASFGEIQGSWRGTDPTDSTPGTWIKGMPQCFTGERSKNQSSDGLRGFAFGNGADGQGVAMPYAGRILAATISHSSALTLTSPATALTEVTWKCHINGVSQTGDTDIVAGSTSGAGSVTNTNISKTFNAGDRINWRLVDAEPTTPSDSNRLNAIVVLTFWVMFD